MSVLIPLPLSSFFNSACLGCKAAASPNCGSFKDAVAAGHDPEAVEGYIKEAQKDRELAGCSNSQPPPASAPAPQ